MKYVIGIDFGTLSARAVVIDIKDGHTAGEEVFVYPSGIMETKLPDGTPLSGDNWALADPNDYLQALKAVIRGAVKNSGADKKDICALSVAATACTILPVDSALIPLCETPSFKNHPQAYCKLWKHHRAQVYADQMTQAAHATGLSLTDYGGKISSEWAIPKVLETAYNDNAVYHAADRFMQISDWLTALLTGNADVQNGSIAAYKAMKQDDINYPPKAFLQAADPLASEIFHQKLRGHRIYAGERAGYLTSQFADELGLMAGITVAMAHTDAHAAALGAGEAEEGDYVYVIGTSTCGHLISKMKKSVSGVTGAIDNGLIPGYTCYSAGQAAAGDMLDWFIKHSLPYEYLAEAKLHGISAHQLLTKKAAAQKVGECGLIALDWFNGNRSTLMNSHLTGAIIGLNMKTKSEDIYRALLEAIAFGHREIIEHFRSYGLVIKNITVCGGIVGKNRLLMQIMADVLNRPIMLSKEKQATALGAAMCAASALGEVNGGYATLADAVRAMKGKEYDSVYPQTENIACYDALYHEYDQLYQYFGQKNPELMQELNRLKSSAM